MPRRRAVLMIRHAISPRLAIRIRLNIPPPAVPSGFAAGARNCQRGGWSGLGRRRLKLLTAVEVLYLDQESDDRGRRDTWLAIQAKTTASTSTEIRVRSQSASRSAGATCAR